MRNVVRLSVIALLMVINTRSFSQSSDTIEYIRKEVRIKMRDGISLNTVIFTPRSIKEPLPFIFLRTPYGVSQSPSPNRNSYIQDMAKDGYIFVFQDIRGRYKSDGIFEMQRFMRDKKNPKSIDESTDTYDAIDWLIKNN